MQTDSGFRYHRLADHLEAEILEGTFRAGEKLPSIRALHRQTGLSISTVYHAFIELEKRGMVAPRQKSGYFVKPLLENILPSPTAAHPPAVPRKIDVNNLAFALVEAMGDPHVLQLGGALVDERLLPVKEMAAPIKSAPFRELAHHLSKYDHYMGLADLRRRIAQRMAPVCGDASADNLLITNGCIDAVGLCLQAVARPGDTILVESPTFPWFLQLLEDLELRALEISADPRRGIDLDAVRTAVRHHEVRACLLIPNFNNPLGFLMPEESKKDLVKFLNRRDIPIIEDDIYGELYFGAVRPTPLKAFDRKGLVLYCASFSKSLAPGVRVGWSQPGRFLDRVRRLKLNRAISSPGITQWALARFLKNGGYDRHLRRLRSALKNQTANTALAVARHFPEGTKISAPHGGLTLWVQLAPGLDSIELFRRALAHKIAVFPGTICASGPAYGNCIRISCGSPFDDRLEQGLRKLAGLVHELCAEQRSKR